jgi:DNA modification methylase
MPNFSHRLGLNDLADIAKGDGKAKGEEPSTDGRRLRDMLEAHAERSNRLVQQTILVGDCIEGLKTLADNSVNLIVTSPPYNVGKNYAEWNDRLSYEDYIDFTKEWITQCYRVLAEGEILCVNLPTADFGGRLSFIDTYQLLRQGGFWHQDFIAWVKWNRKSIDTSGFAVSKRKIFSKKRTRKLIAAFEVILVVRKPPENPEKAKELNVDPVNAPEMNFNIWHIPPIWDKLHPAPFPEELPKRLITLYSQEGDTVLDPFAGTGTTLQVAHDLKRNSVGCEISQDYVELMRQRFEFQLQIYRVSRNMQTRKNTNQGSN